MHRYLWPHCRCFSFHLLVPSLVGSGVGICIERDLRFKGWGRGVSRVALDRSIHCSDSRSVSPTGNIADRWVRQYFKSPLCSKFSLFWCSSLTRIGAYGVECPEHFPGAELNILYFHTTLKQSLYKFCSEILVICKVTFHRYTYLLVSLW